MDLDSLDVPMFVDFDLIKRGEEEGEGDEWFGEFNNKNIIISLRCGFEEMHLNFNVWVVCILAKTSFKFPTNIHMYMYTLCTCTCEYWWEI